MSRIYIYISIVALAILIRKHILKPSPIFPINWDNNRLLALNISLNSNWNINSKLFMLITFGNVVDFCWQSLGAVIASADFKVQNIIFYT